MSNSIAEPRVVEAGRGAAWWARGFHIFKSAFGTWIGIMIVYLIISMLIGLVPFVGTVGHWLLTPVFMGGLMIGCQSLERDGPLRFSHLFEGFQGSHFVPLMIIGAVNIALTLAIAAITSIGVIGGMKLTDMMGAGGDPFNAFTGSVRAMTGTGILAGLVVLVIVAVIAMLNWFAPALVALHGVSAVEAMKLSFVACLRNWLPFLVYGVVAIALMFAAGLGVIGLGLVFGAGAIFGSGGGMGAFLGFMVVLMIVAIAGALIVGPVVFGSTYAAYKDAFDSDGEVLVNPAYQ